MTVTQVLDPPTRGDGEQPSARALLAVLHPRTQLAARARLTVTIPDGWRAAVDSNSYLRLTDLEGRVWLIGPPADRGKKWTAAQGPLGNPLGMVGFPTSQECVDFIVSQAGHVAKLLERGRS